MTSCVWKREVRLCNFMYDTNIIFVVHESFQYLRVLDSHDDACCHLQFQKRNVAWCDWSVVIFSADLCNEISLIHLELFVRLFHCKIKQNGVSVAKGNGHTHSMGSDWYMKFCTACFRTCCLQFMTWIPVCAFRLYTYRSMPEVQFLVPRWHWAASCKVRQWAEIMAMYAAAL